MRYLVKQAEYGFQVLDTTTGRPVALAALNYEVPERSHAERYAASLNSAIARWQQIRDVDKFRVRGAAVEIQRAA